MLGGRSALVPLMTCWGLIGPSQMFHVRRSETREREIRVLVRSCVLVKCHLVGCPGTQVCTSPKKKKNSSNPLKCSSASIIRKKIIKSTQNVICYPLLHLMSDEYYYCKSLRLISIQLLHIPLGALIYSVTSCSMCCLWRSFPV